MRISISRTILVTTTTTSIPWAEPCSSLTVNKDPTHRITHTNSTAVCNSPSPSEVTPTCGCDSQVHAVRIPLIGTMEVIHPSVNSGLALYVSIGAVRFVSGPLRCRWVTAIVVISTTSALYPTVLFGIVLFDRSGEN